MMSDVEKKTTRKLLIGSLALNVFFVGTVVGGTIIGGVSHHRPEGARHAPPIHSFANPRQILHEAAPAHRHAMVKLVRQDMKKLHPLLQDVGARRRAAIEAMSAQTFDAAATLQAFEALVAAETKAHAASNETLVRMLASLPDEERKRIVGTLREGRPDQRRGKFRDHRPGRLDGPEEAPEPED